MPDVPAYPTYLTSTITLCDHLTELVLLCELDGLIHYANRAAQQHSASALIGQPFIELVLSSAAAKGWAFFEAARQATPAAPTEPWEIPIGNTSSYAIASFRGYHDDAHVVLFAQVESERVSHMQQELLDLTSDLTEAQRQLHRQNRALQQALDEQRRLVETIQELSAPIAPLANDVLLLPLIGHIDSHRANRITEELLRRVEASRTRYVILDITGIVAIDTAVARHLIDTAQAVRLLGAQAVLVGINPTIAETIVHLGITLHNFAIYSDLQHAIAAVLRQRKGHHR